MQRRVVLRALDLVLLDEPMSSLDAADTALLASALRALTARGGRGLLAALAGVQPDLPADRMLVLTDGTLTAT